MSHPQFSGGPSGMLIELDKNTSNIWGSGDLSYPCLGWQVPLFISFHEKMAKRYAFRTVHAQLFLNRMKIADSHPVSIDRILRHGEPKHTEHLNLEFPVRTHQIRAIEDFRQGGSLKLQLWVQLHIDAHRPVSVMDGDVWELESLSVARLQDDIDIAQTHWVERVLPQIGHGKIHIVEFAAVPLAACEALDHSYKSLKQAEEKHRLGFYDDAVGKCRMALEKFFDSDPVDPTHPESRRIPVLKKSWERKLGKATYDWLNGALGGIKVASNPPHHLPDAHYDQLESQMILAITTVVVAYIARHPDLQEKE